MPEPPASTSEPTPQTSRCWTAGARRSAPSSSRSASGSGSRPRTHSEQPGTLLPLETEILQTMREHSGSRSLTAHGTLYKALSRLEEFGLLTSRWEDAAAAVEGRPRRRLYQLTGEGARVAERARAET